MKPPTKYLAEIGRKGGKAKGTRKSRGGKEYYRNIARKRWEKSREK